jgi:hypothetical protein
LIRDRQERDNLIQRQLEERRALQLNIKNVRQDRNKGIDHLKTMVFSALPPEMKDRLQKQFELHRSRQTKQSLHRNNDYDLSM